MLDIFKFFSALLVPPGIWILIIFILAIIMYRNSRRWGIIWIVVGFTFYLSTTSLVSDSLVRIIEGQYDHPAEVSGDVVILLTGGATLDRPGTDGRGLPTDETAGRILAAAALYHEYKIPIIIAGGQVYPDSGNEAEVSKQSLLSIGVMESLIFLDNRSKSTSENAQNVKFMLDELGFHTPILVTSAIHMQRAVRNFEKNGVEVIAYPTAYLSSDSFQFHIGHLIPSDHALAKTGHGIKELYGFIASYLLDI